MMKNIIKKIMSLGVVVAVLAVVLAVLFIYLISIDRKLKRTEDKLKNKY